ncbi:MAG: hypothetical protein KME21_26865 [Desmonostoc vinosum HA7617-LM4]|nr:hypothetical protein [Desmonostoc vinosum HA7617-LM4]
MFYINPGGSAYGIPTAFLNVGFDHTPTLDAIALNLKMQCAHYQWWTLHPLLNLWTVSNC